MQAQTIRNLLLVVLLVVSLSTLRANAQANLGAISGTVTDPTGAAVPGATVVVTNTSTGIAKTLTTNADGYYSAEDLDAGQYTVKVTDQGFQAAVFSNLQLSPGQRLANNAMLKVGNVSSQVVVNANALQVNTQTSESGGTISSKQISNLMLNGRNFQTLGISIPGVSSTAGADSLNGGGLEGGTTLIVNGQSTEYTTYTIDGVYNMNSGNLSNINILPIVDAISQFSVLKDNYSAQYGFAGSGQIVVQTKAGGREFHGDAWDFLRNSAFDANNYFSTSKEPLHQNIFGYTLGGPVVIPGVYNTRRNRKTFFFASNQWYVISAGQVSRGSVFTDAMRNGDFSASPTLPSSKALAIDAHSQALLASEGKTGCLTGPTTINPTCFDPVAASLIQTYMPQPNNQAGGFLNYVNGNPLTTSQVDYVYRLDQQLPMKTQLTGRIMYEQVKNGFPYDTWGGMPYTTTTDSYYTTAFNGLIRLQSTVTPNLMNTVSLAETYDKPRINTLTGGKLPSGVSIQQQFPNAPTLGRMPNVSISSGWSGFGVSSEPITASDGEGVIQDDLNWVHGKQVIQAGLLYMFGIKRQNVFTNPQGSFTFTGVHTGDPAADFLLGLDNSYSQASSQKLGSYHYRQGAWYVQDDWNVMPRLTLNMGVRWVYFSNDTVSGDEVTTFNPALYDASQAPVVNVDGSLQVNAQNEPVTSSGTVANLLNGLEFAGKNGVPSGFFIPKKTNFAPRVGFAYDVFGNGKTSVRGGYGIGYSRIPLEQIYNAFGQNPPFNQSANILNSLLSNGTAGTQAAPTTQTLDNVPLNFTPSQIQTYSLTLEQQIIPNMIASVAYTGSLGRHLMTYQGGYDFNFPLPVTAPSTSGCLAAGQAASSRYDFDPCINVGLASEDYTRPYKGYSTMNNEYDEGSSNYNSLQSSLRYRTNNLQLTVAYTYQKTLGTIGAHGAGSAGSQSTPAQNPRNFHAEYGPPSYDFTNDLTATWVYRIPIFDHSGHAMQALLGDWSFSGLALHQSGFAMSPGMGTTTRGLAIRPDQVKAYSKVGRLNEWFNTTDFAAPAYGFFGDARNGTIRGPAYTSLNVALQKTWPLVSRLHAQFRAEAFNVANHPNFRSVDTGVGDGSYGQVTNAGDPRILEFSLKLVY
ncbi:MULTISPECIES: carboxypeptidase regulatory-like domain-containing protein [Acidobacterium]|uniref:Cna protein B-type domain protein n=1 Tax=Acidobacterium capsulatum (strain ATCC 51196 / DSM 11244 / BCRC 80197 / JCM 7670 / NBRC 15755 / NCIMB 13165 / 161) TaxID=240015 RepID=C1F2B2_ACIC5|nr:MULTISPECIES: carboxypeptidase regulatory-like domain-containing protein [Acidobacterium]ACO32167.1 Cna protein B-type domain protein [Acidobacterium capsulatum ATCC 51196]